MIQVLAEKPINKLVKLILKLFPKDKKYTVRQATQSYQSLYKINVVIHDNDYYIACPLFRTDRRLTDALSSINQHAKMTCPYVMINLIGTNKDADYKDFCANKLRWSHSFKNVIIS